MPTCSIIPAHEPIVIRIIMLVFPLVSIQFMLSELSLTCYYMFPDRNLFISRLPIQKAVIILGHCCCRCCNWLFVENISYSNFLWLIIQFIILTRHSIIICISSLKSRKDHRGCFRFLRSWSLHFNDARRLALESSTHSFNYSDVVLCASIGYWDDTKLCFYYSTVWIFLKICLDSAS